MKIGLAVFTIVAVGAVFFLFFMPPQEIVVAPVDPANSAKPAVLSLPSVPEAVAPTSTPTQPKILESADLPNQLPLQNPPEVVKGIYVTAWSAGSTSRINSLISLIKRTELNAVVIDIKDFSGHVSYKTGVPAVAATGAENELRILRPNALIKKLHDENVYIIGRITVFQDPILAKAHPELALKNKITGQIWTDNKKLAWMDAAAKSVWDYNVEIAKDAFARGFDEIQFDYIRFASDGDLGQIGYPFWDEKTPRRKIIGNFFKYLRESLPDKKISADLFGLSTIDTWDDLGIGQIIEDAYANFDYVSPMVYPSHYASGFMGFKSPAKYPYEIVKYSMEKALTRLIAEREAQSTTSTATSTTETLNPKPYTLNSKLRPWLQDFDLGAVYDAAMVRRQIQATYDAFVASSTNYQLPTTSSRFGGWLLWDPANTYTEGALEKN